MFAMCLARTICSLLIGANKMMRGLLSLAKCQ